MHYSIRHITRFRYSAPVRESVMELRMQPRSEGPQALRSFQIVTNPRAQLYAYTDYLGNAVYHFNALRAHQELRIETQAIVEMTVLPPPPESVDPLEWQRYNSYNLTADHFDLLEPSKFVHDSGALSQFTVEHGLTQPAGDPLTALRHLSKVIHDAFDYEVGVTEVHSPIETALKESRGVCQDFAHIMIAVARGWGIPARYVSGYLHHRRKNQDRSGEDATHAWVEAYLPSLGWIGFDPTNNIMAGERHIRVAVGRDYADVPPTRGTYKGNAESELAISVSVQPTQAPIRHGEFLRVARPMMQAVEKPAKAEQFYHQQQQQQQ
ncbi:MAG: transglutaminase family protein [Proteobacteria bacterium]|nr:transglutaminase family protein [Pseudomonadota bacterium]